MTTQKTFQSYNLQILQGIIEKDEPIECDSFSDKYDDVINYTIEQNGYESN